MEAISFKDFGKAWFWGMLALAVALSVGVRLGWVYFLGVQGAEVAGNFVMFAVILGGLSLRTAPIDGSPGRRVAAILFASAVATAVLTLFKAFLP